MQLPVTLQNGNEVNRETLPPQAASSVCDSTKQNGLVTISIFHIEVNSIKLYTFWDCIIYEWLLQFLTRLLGGGYEGGDGVDDREIDESELEGG